VSIADPRPNFASPSRFPLADLLRTGPAEQLAGLVDPPPDGVAVVMSHHYVHDVPVLRELLKRPLAYIGLLGPRKRGERILRDLRNEGATFTDAELERLHSPVGLDLGAETPEEVALSIIAEIRAVLAGRDGRPLRERNQPIHDETPPLSS
jgi:xanthine/CO dehydrogenase XdhC/CoxF family maturation factor